MENKARPLIAVSKDHFLLTYSHKRPDKANDNDNDDTYNIASRTNTNTEKYLCVICNVCMHAHCTMYNTHGWHIKSVFVLSSECTFENSII